MVVVISFRRGLESALVASGATVRRVSRRLLLVVHSSYHHHLHHDEAPPPQGGLTGAGQAGAPPPLPQSSVGVWIPDMIGEDAPWVRRSRRRETEGGEEG